MALIRPAQWRSHDSHMTTLLLLLLLLLLTKVVEMASHFVIVCILGENALRYQLICLKIAIAITLELV